MESEDKTQTSTNNNNSNNNSNNNNNNNDTMEVEDPSQVRVKIAKPDTDEFTKYIPKDMLEEKEEENFGEIVSLEDEEKRKQWTKDQDETPKDDDLLSLKKAKITNPFGAVFEEGNTEILVERTRYIPLRLLLHERKRLRLVESALFVSEYTDKVDIYHWSSKAKRIHEQLKDICGILCGLLTAADYTSGQKLISNREFEENATFFQEVFEIARRYKINNPEKMRTDYGKMIYLLQDSMIPEIQNMLSFDMVVPVKTVHDFLKTHDGLKVLSDPLVWPATREIIDDGKKPRPQIQREIKEKESAVESLAHKYKTKDLSDEDIRLCLRSIGDNNSFLRYSSYPINQLLNFLTTWFDPEKIESDLQDLSISAGTHGARLSHSHTRQFHYVSQTLCLWKTIQSHMYELWWCAEQDLLDSTLGYRLMNTGQGLQRVQAAPRVGRVMGKILGKVKREVGNSWVGSSVVHLGDTNVPNAMMFIDKYNQIPRIINPLVLTVQNLDKLYTGKGTPMDKYIDSFGGPDKLKLQILGDFFRHAFDGSGATNFFDAGSCIDGRLTSAWNWCSLIEKKNFYPIFLLAGFSGFDGEDFGK